MTLYHKLWGNREQKLIKKNILKILDHFFSFIFILSTWKPFLDKIVENFSSFLASIRESKWEQILKIAKVLMVDKTKIIFDSLQFI